MTVATAKVIETNDSDDSSVEEASDAVSESEKEIGASDDETSNTKSNLGWADSIAKILKSNKPKGKKTLVLSKAKKLSDVKSKKRKSAGFEVATADGEIKEEQIEVEEDAVVAPQPPRKKKKELPNCRIKPNILERDRERTLAKIATKGVVQLFNAVRLQQKDISKKLEEAGPLDVRKEKVLKSIDKKAFLDVLMGEKSQLVDAKQDERVKTKKESTWSVLRDDFMMGAKLKDWDKELEKETETEETVEMESDG